MNNPNAFDSLRPDMMDELDEEAQIQRAIALSLGLVEEEPTRQIIAEHSRIPLEDTNPVPTSKQEPSRDSAPSSSSNFIMSRAQMERERLERVAKRKREENTGNNGVKIPKTSHGSLLDQDSDHGALHTKAAQSQKAALAADSNRELKSKMSGSRVNEEFKEGKLALTYVEGHPLHDKLRFEDIVDKTNLRRALFSAFQLDAVWLKAYLPPDIPVCLVVHPEQKSDKGTVKVQGRITLVEPPMQKYGYGTMHAKLIALQYPTFLRIAICSGNLVSYDWNLLENVVYVQDFPSFPVPGGVDSSEFSRDLLDFVTAMCVPSTFLAMFSDYDFSKARVQLVCSKPGTHSGADLEKYGHTRLAHLVRKCGAQCDLEDGLAVECQTSSLGSLNRSYLLELYRSFCGQPLSESRTHKLESPELPPVAIIYPTLQTVETSSLGPQNAGTICFRNEYYQNPQFPRGCLYDCKSRRKGCLMHTKFILAGFLEEKRISDHRRLGGWFYCGKDGLLGVLALTAPCLFRGVQSRSRNRQLQLRINNWELGCFVPLYSTCKTGGGQDWFVQHGVPVPYVRPPDAYGSGDKPWLQTS
ncbi:uncharacterized protein VTP21DRAFT_984 [Calcarisporiella thermophila]|uniref:uncharacterized protein n=1 Tax=Calcarisporiella thermophila TaxID=911321 RepID=UPI003742C0A3